MINLISTREKINPDYTLLNGVYSGAQTEVPIMEKFAAVSYQHEMNKAYIYLGDANECLIDDLQKAAKAIVKANKKGFIIDLQTFVTPRLDIDQILEVITVELIVSQHNLWNKKTKPAVKKALPIDILVLGGNEDIYNQACVFGNNMNWVRDFQVRPHNNLNSEQFTMELQRELEPLKDRIAISIIDRGGAQRRNMNLFLSVNAGSAYEPRCIVLSYRGDPDSMDKTAIVGKGIMFDSGGMNIKINRYMEGMKMDMSGAAITAGIIKTIAELNLKTNVVGILMCTDNMISPRASKVDDVVVASNGLSVEINNTDAEGRLVLADGLVLGVRELKATRIIDIATLTGAILIALGDTYTGAWSTDEDEWKLFEQSAKNRTELVWRLPFHNDFLENMKKSKIADLYNTDYSGNAGSSSAAMFLRQFTDDIPFIHLDIAGTACDVIPSAPMLRTIVDYTTRKVGEND